MNQDDVFKNIKRQDPAQLDLSEDYFNKLHDRIMMAIEEKEIQKARPWTAQAKEKLWRLRWAGASMVMSLALILMAHSFLQTTRLDPVMTQAVSAPDDFAAILTHESQNDFFVDVASRNLNDLSDKELKEVFEIN